MLRQWWSSACSSSRKFIYPGATAAVGGVARLKPSPPWRPAANEITRAAIDLAAAFAERAGGIAADAWAALPAAIDRLDADLALKLLRRSVNFLERGGAAALHLLIAGGEILRTLPECFDEWIDLLWAVASHGNAGLVAFVRSSPAFFQTIAAQKDRNGATKLATRDRLNARSRPDRFRSRPRLSAFERESPAHSFD